MGNGVPAGLGIYPYAAQGGIEHMQLGVENLASHTHAVQVNATGFTFKLAPITATASGTLSVNASATGGTTNIPGGTTGFPAQIPDMSSFGLSNTFYGSADGTNSMPVDVSVTIPTPTAVVTNGAVIAQIDDTGGGDSFPIVQPWLALNFVMATMGIYPVRN
jgi:microcystin-dependent protein